MEIIETSIFTRQVSELLSDESYSELQLQLVNRPGMGDEIKGSGGLRKIRWTALGHGKSGGVRIIYYWFISAEKILMLYMYPKNKQDDLTADQLKVLKRIVSEEYDGR